MKLELLRDILINAGVTPVFVHRMEAEVDQGVLLRSPLTGHAWRPDTPGYFKSSVQVVIRHSDQATGDALAKQISDLLTISLRDLSGAGGAKMHIKRMEPRTLPIIYPRSVGNEVEWSLEFFVAYTIPLGE